MKSGFLSLAADKSGGLHQVASRYHHGLSSQIQVLSGKSSNYCWAMASILGSAVPARCGKKYIYTVYINTNVHIMIIVIVGISVYSNVWGFITKVIVI